jgi:WD40 repeat protein
VLEKGVFVSHSSADGVLAHAVADRIRQLGYDPFVDLEGIPGGTLWETEIYKALRRCFALVLCATPEAMSSTWVLAEVILARYAGKPIVPLVLQSCTLPSLLESTQHLDFTRDPEAGYAKLAESLTRLLPVAANSPERVWPQDKCPYPGLFAFTEEYAPVFFGRERELSQALEVLRQRGRPVRFLTFVGPSGSGKSSFVHAGLIPKLRDGAIPGSAHWTYVPPFTPMETPFRNLSVSVRIAGGGRQHAQDIEQALRRSPAALIEEATDLLSRVDARVVIVIDQFEELERRTTRNEAKAFVASLRESLDIPNMPLTVIATLRADFIAACLEVPGMADLIGDNIRTIGPIDRGAFRRIIDGPAQSAGLELRPGVVEDLLDETPNVDALPHLAFILRELWSRALVEGSRRVVTREIRSQVGSLADVIARHAQSRLDEAPSEHRDELIDQLTRLADVDESGQYTRRSVALASIPEALRAGLDRFIDARLVVSFTDDLGRGMIGAAHEALFRSWTPLQTRLRGESERIRLRRDVDRDANEWQRRDRSSSFLWRGERLSAGATLVAAERLPRNDVRTDFISASSRAERQTRERESTVLTALAERELDVDPEGAILLCLAAVEQHAWTLYTDKVMRAALAASRVRGSFSHQDAISGVAFNADGSLIVTASNDYTACVWDIRSGAVRHVFRGHTDHLYRPSFSSDGKLVVTASRDRTARLWDVATGSVRSVLSGHEGPVWGAAFSADDKVVVTVSDDHTARIWDVADGTELGSLRHDREVYSGAFSPDGRLIVTGSVDRTARVWDVATGAERHVLRGHDGTVEASFSPDGLLILTASSDGTARVWTVETGAERQVLHGHTGNVTAAFSPDGTRIVTASYDHTARIWDVMTGAELHALSAHKSEIFDAVFSANGMLIVTASGDRTARVWDTATGIERHVLTGHKSQIYRAVFSPNGMLVATASKDHTARVWNIATGSEQHVLRGHESVVRASFSSDGLLILTISSDGSARVWDTRAGAARHVIPAQNDVVTGAFSPDGKLLVTALSDKTATLWDTATGTRLHVLRGHEGAVLNAAFSSDGRLVVTASTDNTARVWDMITGSERIVLRGHEHEVKGAVFSHDGSMMVTWSRDKTARIWDVTDRAQRNVLQHDDEVSLAAFSDNSTAILTVSDKSVQIWEVMTGVRRHTLRGHEDKLFGAAFNSRGTLVVTASVDSTARIWDVATGKERHVLSGHTGPVLSAAFSPDGAVIVTASSDKTAKIWDVETGAERHTFDGHENGVASAAFNPDGAMIVTGSYDHTARVWEFPSNDMLLRIAHQRVYRSLSADERRRSGLS